MISIFGWSGEINGTRWDCAIPGMDYSVWPEGEPCPVIDDAPPAPTGGWLAYLLGAVGTDTIVRAEPWSDAELDALAVASLEGTNDS